MWLVVVAQSCSLYTAREVSSSRNVPSGVERRRNGCFRRLSNFEPTTPNISFVPRSPKRSATMLDPFAQLFQHCWGHARALQMVSKDLWVVSFPGCTAGPNIVGSCCIRLHTTANTNATTPNIVGPTLLGVVASVCTPLPTPTRNSQHCWELLHPFAHHYQHQRDNSQHCWPNNVVCSSNNC